MEVSEFFMQSLETLKSVDVKTVDPNTLVDINDVHINKSLPQSERILDYIRQIKNPYCYRCGKTIVKISFAETSATLEDRLEHYIKSL